MQNNHHHPQTQAGPSESMVYFLTHYHELSGEVKDLVSRWMKAKDFGTKDMVECKLEHIYKNEVVNGNSSETPLS